MASCGHLTFSSIFWVTCKLKASSKRLVRWKVSGWGQSPPGDAVCCDCITASWFPLLLMPRWTIPCSGGSLHLPLKFCPLWSSDNLYLNSSFYLNVAKWLFFFLSVSTIISWNCSLNIPLTSWNSLIPLKYISEKDDRNVFNSFAFSGNFRVRSCGLWEHCDSPPTSPEFEHFSTSSSNLTPTETSALFLTTFSVGQTLFAGNHSRPERQGSQCPRPPLSLLQPTPDRNSWEETWVLLSQSQCLWSLCSALASWILHENRVPGHHHDH